MFFFLLNWLWQGLQVVLKQISSINNGIWIKLDGSKTGAGLVVNFLRSYYAPHGIVIYWYFFICLEIKPNSSISMHNVINLSLTTIRDNCSLQLHQYHYLRIFLMNWISTVWNIFGIGNGTYWHLPCSTFYDHQKSLIIYNVALLFCVVFFCSVLWAVVEEPRQDWFTV